MTPEDAAKVKALRTEAGISLQEAKKIVVLENKHAKINHLRNELNRVGTTKKVLRGVLDLLEESILDKLNTSKN